MTAEFEKAASDVKNLKSKPSNDEMLQLYGLFKQAKEGDVNTTRPGMFDMTGKAKWDAWEKNKGKAPETAQSEYVTLVKQLIEKYGLQ